MKNLNPMVKKIGLLSILLVMASCMEKPVATTGATANNGKGGSTGGSATGGSNSGGGGTTIPTVDTSSLSHTVTPVRVKNYNQYNMTLEKLTGLNRSRYTGIFEELKASMPADNDISGMTSFNLIAMTRLADAYCNDFVNEKIPSNFFNSNQEEQITDYMFDSFLDEAPSDQPNYYAGLRSEIANIFRNDDGAGGKLFPSPSTNVVQLNKDYSVAGCVAILASTYVTLLK